MGVYEHHQKQNGIIFPHTVHNVNILQYFYVTDASGPNR